MKISQILHKDSGSKNDTQQEYVWHLNTQPEGVPEVKMGGIKGSTYLLTVTERVEYTGPVVMPNLYID